MLAQSTKVHCPSSNVQSDESQWLRFQLFLWKFPSQINLVVCTRRQVISNWDNAENIIKAWSDKNKFDKQRSLMFVNDIFFPTFHVTEEKFGDTSKKITAQRTRSLLTSTAVSMEMSKVNRSFSVCSSTPDLVLIRNSNIVSDPIIESISRRVCTSSERDKTNVSNSF